MLTRLLKTSMLQTKKIVPINMTSQDMCRAMRKGTNENALIIKSSIHLSCFNEQALSKLRVI